MKTRKILGFFLVMLALTVVFTVGVSAADVNFDITSTGIADIVVTGSVEDGTVSLTAVGQALTTGAHKLVITGTYEDDEDETIDLYSNTIMFQVDKGIAYGVTDADPVSDPFVFELAFDWPNDGAETPEDYDLDFEVTHTFAADIVMIPRTAVRHTNDTGTTTGDGSVTAKINLTRETIDLGKVTKPAATEGETPEATDFSPKMFSIDGGEKWKKYSKALAIDKLVNKDLTLVLADGIYDKKEETFPAGTTVITFAKINARPKKDDAPKLVPNYLLKADWSGQTNGNWVMTEKNESAIIANGWQIVQPAGKKLAAADIWDAASANGLLVPNNRVKVTYFIRKAPMGTAGETNAEVTAGSKPQKIGPKGVGNVIKKVDPSTKGEFIAVKKNWVFFNMNATTPYNYLTATAKATAAQGLNHYEDKDELKVGGTYNVFVAPTEKKPASASRGITFNTAATLAASIDEDAILEALTPEDAADIIEEITIEEALLTALDTAIAALEAAIDEDTFGEGETYADAKARNDDVIAKRAAVVEAEGAIRSAILAKIKEGADKLVSSGYTTVVATSGSAWNAVTFTGTGSGTTAVDKSEAFEDGEITVKVTVTRTFGKGNKAVTVSAASAELGFVFDNGDSNP